MALKPYLLSKGWLLWVWLCVDYSFGGTFAGTVDITKEEIDAIIKDKPFVMISQVGHGGWANSKA